VSRAFFRAPLHQELMPAYEMQESMMNFVKSAFEDADILIYMVEIGNKT
jgi:GTP-binding protein Era